MVRLHGAVQGVEAWQGGDVLGKDRARGEMPPPWGWVGVWGVL